MFVYRVYNICQSVSCSPALSLEIFIEMFAAVQLWKLLKEFVSVVLIRDCDQL